MIFQTNNDDLEIQIQNITSEYDFECGAYQIHAKIKIHKEYIEGKGTDSEIKEIGLINIFYMPNARFIDESIIEVCDSISQDLYYASYFAQSYFDASESLTPDWMHISSIKIAEEFRGFKYGWFVAREMIKLFGTKSVISGVPKEEWLIDYWKRFGLVENYKIPGEKPLCFYDTELCGKGFLEDLL